MQGRFQARGYMTGFIAFWGDSNDNCLNTGVLCPACEEPAITQTTLGSTFKCVTWGASSGDIHCAKNNNSFVILSGYITEAPFKEESATQEETTQSLLEILDRNSSVAFYGKIADQIYGSFSFIYFNLKNNKGYCITDRIASRPIWVQRHMKTWILSSNANSIMYATDTLHYDLGALGAFLLYGGPVEPTKSIYHDINSLQEGSITELRFEGNVTRHRWYTYRHRPDETLSFKDWIELATTKLKSSASRVLKTTKKPMVFFSGGVDSRLTASVLRSVGADPLLITLGDHENLEIKVAQNAARALNCVQEIIIRDPYWYFRALPRAVYETNGHFLWTHGHFSEAYHNVINKYDVDAAFLGDFCEAFSKLCCSVEQGRYRVWTVQEFLRNFDKLPLPLYRPSHKEYTLRLLNPRIKEEVEHQLNRDISNRYGHICDVSDDPKIVADYFFRWQTVANMPTVAMFFDVRSTGPERSIMFDKDVHELIEILPSSMRDGANMGSFLIKKLWPSASRVVNSNSLLPLTWPGYLHKLTKYSKPFIGKLRRTLIENTYKTTGGFPEKSMLYSSDEKWQRCFHDILRDESLFQEEIFDYGAIKDCWTTFCEGNLEVSSDLEKIVQIGLLNSYKQKKSVDI